ncbi:MAG: cytochrome c3 family protein [Bacillota bacterium]|nr:cytochrome c3 family protein [Bacillota bacterium]
MHGSIFRPEARGAAFQGLGVLVGLLWLALSVPQPAQAATGTCSPCHARILSSWVGSTHQAAGAQVKGGFRCQECHLPSLLHPSAVTPANSPDRCGRCHWAQTAGKSGKRPTFQPKTVLDQKAWKDSKHAAVKVNCTSCHSAHRYAEGGDQHLLRQAGDALCRSCHREVRHQASGSTAEAIAKQPCVACHDPHRKEGSLLKSWSGGEKRDFQKRVVHKPVAEKNCKACHSAHVMIFGTTPPETDEELEEEPAPGGAPKVAKGLLLAEGRVFCYLCHGKFKEKFEASGHARIHRFKRGEEQSPCMGCHLPHASDYPRLLRYPGNQLCLSCHPGYAPHHFLARGGVKQSQLECVKCHNPHGSGNKRLLVQPSVCKMCHNF